MGGVKIGALTLPLGLFLAPMAGMSDGVFRAVCRAHGAEFTVSEMVSAKALCFEQRGRAGAPCRTAALCRLGKEEMPAAIQIFGSEPPFMAEAAARLACGDYRGAQKEILPVAIDLNMGCPVPKVVGNGEGSALLRDPARAFAIVRAVRDAVKLPLTVKIRAGWDEKSKNAPEFAKGLEAAGADLIFVHGRTRSQFYAPGCDLSVIAAVKKSVKIPVIGNGDLFSFADVRHMLNVTGCDGVMIARGALGNPFVFEEIRAGLLNLPYTPPTERERVTAAVCHLRALVREKGEKTGVAEARKHLAAYTRGLRGGAAARDALMRAETPAAVEEILFALVPFENAPENR